MKMNKKELKKIMKEAKEQTILMEYLIELHGYTADGFIINYINNMQENNPKVYKISLEQALQWEKMKQENPNSSDRIFKKAMKKRSQWLIVENEEYLSSK